MSMEVDVRETKSYSDTWDPDEDQYNDRRIRVTNDHYLCCSAYLGKSKLAISINPPPTISGVDKLDYEVTLIYESFTHTHQYKMLSTVATPTRTKVLDINISKVTKIDIKFAIKSTIPDQTVTVKKSWYDTIQAHMGTNVTLVGSDGETTIKKMLLTSHSTEFEAMFSVPTSRESQTNRVLIEEYSKASLMSMAHFLATHEITDGNNTACDLFLLANKYGIKELKSQAEKFLLENVDGDNAREVFRAFVKVGSKNLEELFDKIQSLK